MTMNNSAYEARVRQLESEGLTRSDAQGVADVEIDRLHRAAPELLKALENILYAHDTDNNGAACGEAVLCYQFAEQARHAINQAGGHTLNKASQ